MSRSKKPRDIHGIGAVDDGRGKAVDLVGVLLHEQCERISIASLGAADDVQRTPSIGLTYKTPIFAKVFALTRPNPLA